jgi:hypothetical protein
MQRTLSITALIGSGVYAACCRDERRNISGGKARPECKADDLTTIYEAIV